MLRWSSAFIDLIAASTNALKGVLLARRPDHSRNFPVVGILLMALLGGLGGGITRDVLLNKIPGALTKPAYVTVCLIAGIIGYQLAFAKGQLFREGLFQFMTSFSLPWYAIAGAQAAVTAGLPVIGILVIAVIGPTAGRYYIDITCGVPPKQFIRGEFCVHRVPDCGHLARVRRRGTGNLGLGRDLLRRRIHPPRNRPVLRLGGAAGEGAGRRLPALRRRASARTQAQGQVGMGDEGARAHGRYVRRDRWITVIPTSGKKIWPGQECDQQDRTGPGPGADCDKPMRRGGDG